MENLAISFNAIAPMFLIIAAGLLCRRLGVMPREAVAVLNNLVYRVFCPALLFSNIYTATHQGGQVPTSPRLLIFLAAAILVIYGIVFAVTVRTVRDNPRRGTVIHGIFRSNFVILGLPMVTALFPPRETAIVSVAATVVVPIFNVLAVLTLEHFRGGRISPWRMAVQIVKNPLLIGTLLGIAFWLLGLSLPAFTVTAVADVAKVAMPIGLLALGAGFEAENMGRNRRVIAAATVARLALIPCAAIPAAIALGLRGVELATVMAVFASPSAINSYTMAHQMGGDAELAGGIVVATSAVSCVTIFIWTFVLKQGGFI